jgi:hypothetical protein
VRVSKREIMKVETWTKNAIENAIIARLVIRVENNPSWDVRSH